MITIAEYIASENLEGIKKLASELGYPIPKNSKEGYLFLKSLYIKDPELSKKYFAEIHPDKEILFSDSYKSMIAEPLYKNATGCNCGFKNLNEDVLNQVQTFSEKGIYETEKAIGGLSDKIRDLIETKDDRILKYGLVFIAGVLVGKLILNK